jgi:hypothetical protein
MDYVQKFIGELESELYSSTSNTHLQAVSDLIDVSSFIDYFLINELARNVDGYKKSSYFHKDRDSKGGLLHAGPIWDFDWAWKNIDECYFGATDGSGWAFQVYKCNPWPSPPGWMVKLLADPNFRQQVNDRYFELRNTILNEKYIFNYIDSVSTLLDEPQSRHFAKWPILGYNVGTPEVDAQPETFVGEIEKFKSWISKRLGWLDANIPAFIVTGIDHLELKNYVSLYPNPVTSRLIFESQKKVKSITIYAFNGQPVSSKYTSNGSPIELDELSPGLYYLRANFHDGSKWTGKFIKSDH